MKYFKRAGIYKASNVTFNPETMEAHSYGHWQFVTKIGDQVFFNNYPYSITTQGHQRKVRSLLRDLGITIDFEVETGASLSNHDWMNNSLAYAKDRIDSLERQEKKGRKGSWANDNRLEQIEQYKQMIEDVQGLKS